MRIVLLGEDAFSAIVLKSLILANHKLLGVYSPLYNNNIYKRLKAISNKYDVPFYRVADFSNKEFINSLSNLKIDLVVVCHFQKIIQKELIKVPKLGCINLHPSLLPFYRGLTPQHWPIINGDNKTGVTVHYIDEGVDTGDIIIQKEISIEEEMYVSDLQNKMKNIYSKIVNDAIDIICHPNPKLIKQSHLKGSYYGKLRKDDIEISKFSSVKTALNLIRGVSFPYCGARFENLIIWKAKTVDINTISVFNESISSAKLIMIKGEYYIRFFDGLLKIEKSQNYEK